MVLATAGELFLKDVWGLYEYRLHNLPLFIPAGHALVYAAAARMSLRAPRWLPGLVAGGFAVYAAAGAWTGIDTFGVPWFVVFVAYLAVSADRRLCATLFLFALAIEVYGTSLRAGVTTPWSRGSGSPPPIRRSGSGRSTARWRPSSGSSQPVAARPGFALRRAARRATVRGANHGCWRIESERDDHGPAAHAA